MELSTIKLHSMRQIGKAESQITLDDDYNVPDYRPDIVKIIREEGEIKAEEVKPGTGSIWIKGKLCFRVLYRSDRENGKISCLKGEIPFQEKVNMDGFTEYDQIRVKGELEDLTIGVIHSRKINVRAVLVLHAVSEMPEVFEITDGMQESVACMQQKQDVEISELVLEKRDLCRQKNEMILPSSKPNIREILWKSIELRNVGSRPEGARLHLNGEVQVSILYQEEEEPDRIQWYETTLPLECSVELGEENIFSDRNVFYKLQIEEVIKELEVKPDYDGEERMLVLELQVHLYMRVWREYNVQLLEDVYSLKQELLPVTGTVEAENLLIKNDAHCKLTEQMELEENQEKILQICSCEGKVHIDRMEQREKGIFVEGTLDVHLLYITTDDQMPVGAADKLYPFEQLIEIPETQNPVRIEEECSLVQLSATMQDQSHAEIKAVIAVNVLAFTKNSLEHIIEVKEEPVNHEMLQQMPGMAGYIAKRGDTLWNIAKKYHTTVEDIMEINGKNTEDLQWNEKLLIIKKL